jgi:hypothetical protein
MILFLSVREAPAVFLTIVKSLVHDRSRYNVDKRELSGVFGDYRFDIAAHSCSKSKDEVKFERIDVICAFALGIVFKYMDVTIPLPKG